MLRGCCGEIPASAESGTSYQMPSSAKDLCFCKQSLICFRNGVSLLCCAVHRGLEHEENFLAFQDLQPRRSTSQNGIG